jgi:amidase
LVDVRFAPALATVVGLVLLAGRETAPAAQTDAPVSVVEASIRDLRLAMEAGRITSRAITAQYLERLNRYEDRLNAAIAINPRALDEADARDRERQQRRARGPLHGIPIALKDNIQTLDMPTTGGALAFATFRAPYEATLARELRAAGAIVLAKTTLTELANWVAPNMPSGYNALTRFSFNPYDPRRDPRTSATDGPPVLTPGGSSSGIGTAASFWAANVGTETSGSILNPANQTMLVGIKPTVGRISRYGVIPITADQDTPGPLARTVEDAAIMLGAMEGAAPDANDAATRACAPPPGRDYTRFLRRDALKGARIGIPRAFFYDRHDPPGPLGPGGGLSVAQQRLMTEAIANLRLAGATVVEPANLASIVAEDAAANLREWPICIGQGGAKGRDTSCSVVLKYGMKRDFNLWLASLGRAAPVASLTALREWNMAHAKEGALAYGQGELDISDEMDARATWPTGRRISGSREPRASTPRSPPTVSTRSSSRAFWAPRSGRARAIRRSSFRSAPWPRSRRRSLRASSPGRRRSASASRGARAASLG